MKQTMYEIQLQKVGHYMNINEQIKLKNNKILQRQN